MSTIAIWLNYYFITGHPYVKILHNNQNQWGSSPFIFKEIYALEFCSYDYLYSLLLTCLLKVLRQELDSQEEKEWYWFLFKPCSCPWKSHSKLINRKQLPGQRLQFPYHIEVDGQNAFPGKRLVNLGESGFSPRPPLQHHFPPICPSCVIL